jgi:NAD(P)-dependent dehydrogenase (short-subunit alcohol dehydrogenase family)
LAGDTAERNGVGRVAVVTGANRGIGLEVARQLAVRGADVVLTARDPSRGEAARALLAGEGLAVSFQRLDVRDPAQAAALADWLHRERGRLDILVNCAGIVVDPRGVRASSVDPAILRETFETNVTGVLAVTQALLPLMRRTGYGRIVNFSSVLGQLASMGAGTPAYRISKAALNALTRTLAAELSGTNIKVNSLCPGWVRTDMGGPSAPLTPAEGADTAVWLALLPDDGPSGGFFRQRAPVAW